PVGRAAPRKKAEVPRSSKKERVYPESSAFIFPTDRQERTKSNEKSFSGRAGQPLAYDQRLLPPRRRERRSRPPSATLCPARRRRHGPAAFPGLPKSRAPPTGSRERSPGRCVPAALRGFPAPRLRFTAEVRPGAAHCSTGLPLYGCSRRSRGAPVLPVASQREKHKIKTESRQKKERASHTR
uniref:Uncharacterized protein n=1 Tax=Pavo cristatus TaxID=9049 RepID=A0A8C9FXF8_PAVCR